MTRWWIVPLQRALFGLAAGLGGGTIINHLPDGLAATCTIVVCVLAVLWAWRLLREAKDIERQMLAIRQLNAQRARGPWQ